MSLEATTTLTHTAKTPKKKTKERATKNERTPNEAKEARAKRSADPHKNSDSRRLSDRSAKGAKGVPPWVFKSDF